MSRLDVSVNKRIMDTIQKLGDGFRDLSQIKKLYGSPNEYRLRMGDYRILFEVYESQKMIVISHVLHRRESYR